MAFPEEVQAVTRHLAKDERGVGLRATWRPNYGFVNLSLWRDLRCTEAFHLTPVEAANLIAFLASSLASAAPAPVPPSLRAVDSTLGNPPAGPTRSVLGFGRDLRERMADDLERLAHRLRG